MRRLCDPAYQKQLNMALADRLLTLIDRTSLDEVELSPGVSVLDPMHGEHGSEVTRIVHAFHHKFYADEQPRRLLLGINPGRLGAGSTGLCFTDTKRCESDLGIPVNGIRTHEPSSDFFYRMIRSMGGAERFYSRYYVQAVCPLGFTRIGANGRHVNLNYYDDRRLQAAVTPLIMEWLTALMGTGMSREVVYCIGAGKNLAFLVELNARIRFAERIIPLEHPRYIMQYKARQLDAYIEKYRNLLDA